MYPQTTRVVRIRYVWEASVGDSSGKAGRKTINLALQGGGSHGAFAWGALDSEDRAGSAGGKFSRANGGCGAVSGSRDGSDAGTSGESAGATGAWNQGVLGACGPSPLTMARAAIASTASNDARSSESMNSLGGGSSYIQSPPSRRPQR